MEGETKKISFGFSKQLKKPIFKPAEEKKQFIDCLEGKSIKVLGGEIEEEKKPLVIPLQEKDRTRTAASLLRITRELEKEDRGEIINEEVPDVKNIPTPELLPIKNESLNSMAEREILEDLKKDKEKSSGSSSLVVPVPESVKLTGEKESTLEDYENIPVSDFGLAMLRGMGWQEGKGIGKQSKSIDVVLPKLRPKGMGLGADKVATVSKNDVKNGSVDEEIKIIKGAYVKIVAGKQNGFYGQISGFDDDSGRIIVKTAIGGTNLNLNEFMVQAVTKDEYQKNAKVINAAKYEEYKIKELKIQDRDDSGKYDESRDTSSTKRQESKQGHSSKISGNEYDRNKDSSKYRSHRDSRRDESNYEKHNKEDRYSARRSSSSSSVEIKRESDKKRKGKKKRRDRSRSRDHRRR